MGAAATEISTRRATSPASLHRELAGDLNWIVIKALEKDRQRRYPSVSELAADIERHLDNQPVLASPPGRIYRARKFAMRHKAGIIAASAVLIVLIGGIVVSTREAVLATRAQRVALAEKARADKEAAVAKAVNDFLGSDLLSSADLDSDNNNSGSDLTVRVVLDRAAMHIMGKFNGQPEVEGSLRTTIGSAYLSLGLYPEVQLQLEQAVALHRHLSSQSTSARVSALTLLGDLYRLRGNYVLAETTLEEAVKESSALAGRYDPATVLATNNLAIVYWLDGKADEAEGAFTEILDAAKKSKQDMGLILHVKTNLGLFYSSQRKFAEAESLLADVVENQRRRLGPLHFGTLVAMNNLALTYEVEGRLARRPALFSQVLEAARQRLGSDHPNTLMTMASLGDVYCQQRNFIKAQTTDNLCHGAPA